MFFQSREIRYRVQVGGFFSCRYSTCATKIFESIPVPVPPSLTELNSSYANEFIRTPGVYGLFEPQLQHLRYPEAAKP